MCPSSLRLHRFATLTISRQVPKGERDEARGASYEADTCEKVKRRSNFLGNAPGTHLGPQLARIYLLHGSTQRTRA